MKLLPLALTGLCDRKIRSQPSNEVEYQFNIFHEMPMLSPEDRKRFLELAKTTHVLNPQGHGRCQGAC